MKNNIMNKEQEEAAALTAKVQKIVDDFLIKIIEEEVEIMHLPLVISMFAHRAGQTTGIPSMEILRESVERLKMFQDFRDASEGKLPRNGTMDELIDPSLVNDDGESLIEKPPTTQILTAEGLPQADHNTWKG